MLSPTAYSILELIDSEKPLDHKTSGLLQENPDSSVITVHRNGTSGQKSRFLLSLLDKNENQSKTLVYSVSINSSRTKLIRIYSLSL